MAHQLGLEDVSDRLESAWKEYPKMTRLRRWLGNFSNQREFEAAVKRAVSQCPRNAVNQVAFLQILKGDFESAAKELAVSPGLGWSISDHPGHLIFWLFVHYLTSGIIDEKSLSVTTRTSDYLDDLSLITESKDHQPLIKCQRFMNF